MKLKSKFISLTILLLMLVNLNSCGIYRPVSAKDYPPEPEKRVQKNLQEGRGFQIFGDDKKGGSSETKSTTAKKSGKKDVSSATASKNKALKVNKDLMKKQVNYEKGMNQGDKDMAKVKGSKQHKKVEDIKTKHAAKKWGVTKGEIAKRAHKSFAEGSKARWTKKGREPLEGR